MRLACDWREVSTRKIKQREGLLHPTSRARERPEQRDVSNLRTSSGLLTPKEVEITSLSATKLARSIASRQYSATEVTTAFIKAATIAQDGTNCLTEICFEAGLVRAKELDDILEHTGEVVGPLHGVPVSVKDHIDVEGMDSPSGFAGWVGNKLAKKDAVIVKSLRNAGAVIYCKTSNPQSLLSIETNNNIFGRTVNPYNKSLGAGGSSGGEGALVAMRGSPMGIGTDIAGSIRIPAVWNGVYGLKPSVGRLPHTGLQGPHDGMDAIIGACGPLAHTREDLDLFCRVILDQQPWHMEAQMIAKPWIPLPIETSTSLTIAVMRDDGLVAPHPPIAAAMDLAIRKLRGAGHTIMEWQPLRHAEALDMLFTLLLQDRGDEYRDHLALSNEPPVPMIEWLLEKKAPKESFSHPSDLWNVVKKREWLRQDAVEQWSSMTPQPDVILCPGAPTLAPRPDRSRHRGYTAIWNVLDWPAVTFPVSLDAEPLTGPWPPHAARSETEQFVFDEWSEEWYKGAPVGLQLVGRRLEEEKLLRDLEVVDSCLRAASGPVL